MTDGTSSERKPLAALLVASKGPPKGDTDVAAGPDEDEGEQETAMEVASLMGAKDPAAAASALVDTIRQCIARSKAGKY